MVLNNLANGGTVEGNPVPSLLAEEGVETIEKPLVLLVELSRVGVI